MQQAEINRARGGAILRGVAEEDKERPQQSFVEGEDEDRDSEGAREVTGRDRGEGPEKKREDAEEVDAAGGAVGKLDEGGDGGVMLDDRAIAEGPMVAAACAGPTVPALPTPKASDTSRSSRAIPADSGSGPRPSVRC